MAPTVLRIPSSARVRFPVVGQRRTYQAPVLFPGTLSNLVVWSYADQISGNDNDAIGQWDDLSGNGKHFLQSAAGNKPLLKKNIKNGHAAVLFDGTDDRMATTTLAGLFSTAASVCIAYQPSTDSQYSVLINNDNDAWWRHPTNPFMGLYRTARISGFATEIPTTGWHYVTVVSDATNYRVWVDGTAAAQGAQTAGFDAGSILHLGGRDGADPQGQNRFMSGYVGEVFVCATTWDATTLAAVHSYMGGRWT